MTPRRPTSGASWRRSARLPRSPLHFFRRQGSKDAPTTLALPEIKLPYDAAGAAATVAAWRERVEATLPNLLTPTDVTRLQRLLARFIDVVPREYRDAGVQDGKIVIPLEYKQAVQFTQQAQSLVNELAPVWRRDRKAVYESYHVELEPEARRPAAQH